METQAPEICFKDAVSLARMIREREVTALETMNAFLAQINRINPLVNAICTLVDEEELLEAARKADEQLTRREPVGVLHGLPHAVKDVIPTAGIRTTFGSRIYKDFVPTTDELIVERLKEAGAIIIGKTNTPEFGAGSQTFNEVFGATRNPYDLTRTCGGSSGGAAVALTCGMVPLADGSDLGGSLRNPASFCNAVGFRPSPGRIPIHPTTPGSCALAVQGPMARSVSDVAFLLSAIAGPDQRAEISIDEPGSVFATHLDRDFRGTRIAWSRNLGRYPVEHIVNIVCDQARSIFEMLGCEVEENEPDLRDVDEIFQVLRAWSYAHTRGDDLRRNRNLIKDTVVWNIELGLKLNSSEVEKAHTNLRSLNARVAAFFDRYEFLILPVAQVAPFPIEVEWITEIEGHKMQTYIDWMATCYAITVTGLPSISVPCGFTPEGLPIGIQIVGRYRRDLDVLKMAFAFERATNWVERRPPIVHSEDEKKN
ncbi:MAG TPA: amidase [Blastocatellia bacterium]|nr:amidase [Blastocatellia bacterium]